MKKSEDDGTVIVRLYENLGRSGGCSITFAAPVLKAEETNLLEYGGETLPSERNRVSVEMWAGEIRTLRITAGPIAR